MHCMSRGPRVIRDYGFIPKKDYPFASKRTIPYGYEDALTPRAVYPTPYDAAQVSLKHRSLSYQPI
jgi:hypothetical protein